MIHICPYAVQAKDLELLLREMILKINRLENLIEEMNA